MIIKTDTCHDQIFICICFEVTRGAGSYTEWKIHLRTTYPEVHAANRLVAYSQTNGSVTDRASCGSKETVSYHFVKWSTG